MSYEDELEHLTRFIEKDMELDPPAPPAMETTPTSDQPPPSVCMAVQVGTAERDRHRTNFAVRSMTLRRSRSQQPAKRLKGRPTLSAAITELTNCRPTRPARPATAISGASAGYHGRPSATHRGLRNVPVRIPIRIARSPEPTPPPVAATQSPFDEKVMAWLAETSCG